jgi:imidazolonepropionase-like amidohydrolase
MRLIPSLLLAGVSLSSAFAQQRPIVLQTSTVLDGKGGVLRDVRITVDGTNIAKVGSSATGTTDFDLRGLTVMPGWIDTHVHIGWHFNREDRADMSKDSPAEYAFQSAGNAYATLMAGFTIVQSLGDLRDRDLRDLIGLGVLPGPRLLSSFEPFTEKSGTPDQIRALVKERVKQGADVIKLFATKSIRDGGAQTMTDAQLQAGCGEATAQGKRSVVHAHASGGAKAAVLAGCTSIEHGSFLDNETLKLMIEHGVFFDPNVSTTHNYLEHKKEYLGIGNYTEDGFTEMEKSLPIRLETLHRALAQHVKIVFGTDAVARAHGRNAEEFIYRVKDGGQAPMDAMVSAMSRAAEALRLQDSLGTIAPGMQADIIALDGDPLKDITAVRRVVFVMKSGKVYRNMVHSHKSN